MRSARSPRAGETKRYPIDSGQRGINREMIPAMCRAVYEDHGDPDVKALAHEIIAQSGCEERDEACHIKAIYDWVEKRFYWIDDPVDEETLIWPKRFAKLLRDADRKKNKVQADCASVSTILISLLGSIGIRACFVFAGDGEYDGQEPVVYHVFVLVKSPKIRRNIYLEPTLHMAAGTARKYKKMLVRDPYQLRDPYQS